MTFAWLHISPQLGAALITTAGALWYTVAGWRRATLTALHTAHTGPRVAAVTAFLEAVNKGRSKPVKKHVASAQTAYLGIVTLSHGKQHAAVRVRDIGAKCVQDLRTCDRGVSKSPQALESAGRGCARGRNWPVTNATKLRLDEVTSKSPRTTGASMCRKSATVCLIKSPVVTSASSASPHRTRPKGSAQIAP
ncbi:hypothetical protein [Streptomyces sp. WM4235]|uniref:hypothetical protein n=1 Tax=Streptomyces sp. WM4235 TaxID=1415551 RepID=UPI000AFB0155|nr:hypothetical protein [Streptomyces sp. WM4235]